MSHPTTCGLSIKLSTSAVRSCARRRSSCTSRPIATDADMKARINKTIDTWKKTAARYDDDPTGKEGRKQIAERAKKSEEKRELSMARYHHYELASALFQIGTVPTSAEVITGMNALAYFSSLIGVAGRAFTAIGLWAPHAVNLGARTHGSIKFTVKKARSRNGQGDSGHPDTPFHGACVSCALGRCHGHARGGIFGDPRAACRSHRSQNLDYPLGWRLRVARTAQRTQSTSMRQ
jgi:hypothetical protein